MGQSSKRVGHLTSKKKKKKPVKNKEKLGGARGEWIGADAKPGKTPHDVKRLGKEQQTQTVARGATGINKVRKIGEKERGSKIKT